MTDDKLLLRFLEAAAAHKKASLAADRAEKAFFDSSAARLAAKAELESATDALLERHASSEGK